MWYTSVLLSYSFLSALWGAARRFCQQHGAGTAQGQGREGDRRGTGRDGQDREKSRVGTGQVIGTGAGDGQERERRGAGAVTR